MLRALFEATEVAGGERLADLATALYALGLCLVLWRALSAVVTGVLEALTSRAGLQLGWTLTCKACDVRTAAGSTCEKCGAALGIPLPARLWARVKAPTQARSQGVAFVLGFVGSLAFVVVTLVAALSLNALSPAGALERLFLGVAAIAWAGAGFLLGRAFSFSRLGPFSRARELAFGSGALALTLLAALLAQAARPVQTREVAELKAEADAVVVDGARLAVANGEVGLQYQVVESPALGMVFAVPLALVGAEGSPPLPLEHGTLEGWLLESSWKRAESLNGRGISVKRRTETFKISAGSSYLLKLGEREPVLEKRR